MAPVAAATSGNSSGATKSKTQSIASPGPAMKPSSDIDLFTTTLPIPVLVSLILFLRRTLGQSDEARVRGRGDISGDESMSGSSECQVCSPEAAEVLEFYKEILNTLSTSDGL